MTSIKIKSTSDLELIAELNKELFPEAIFTEEELEISDWWIAEQDGEPVGFAGIQLKPNESRAFLCRTGVLPHVRGGGLQKRLIRTRVRHAKRNGIARCYTYVWAGNFASMRALYACGFKPYHLQRYDDATYIYVENLPSTEVETSSPRKPSVRSRDVRKTSA